MCNFLASEPSGHLSLHTTGRVNDLVQAQNATSCNCGISTNFSRPAPENPMDFHKRDIKHLVNGLQLGNLNGQAELEREKRPLRHDRVVDDLTCTTTGMSITVQKKKQFDTVRTCLCSITAISTTLSMELKKGTIH